MKLEGREDKGGIMRRTARQEDDRKRQRDRERHEYKQ